MITSKPADNVPRLSFRKIIYKYISYSWKTVDISNHRFIYDLFVECYGGGYASNSYDLIIFTVSRKCSILD